METKYYNKQCTSCRKTIAKNIKGATKKENHSFRGNKCTECGTAKKAQYTKPKAPDKKPQIHGKKQPVIKGMNKR